MLKYIFASLLLCICLLFSSCGAKRYSDAISCNNATMAIKEKIFADTQYSKYMDSDVSYMFCSPFIEDCCVIYSSSSDDIGEFGVLRAESPKQARQLLEDVENYIESIKEERHSFLKSYMPNELDKLSGAQVKQYGKYVVFAIQDPAHVSEIFKEAKTVLSVD